MLVLGLPDSASMVVAVGLEKLLPPSHHGLVLILIKTIPHPITSYV